MKKYWETGEKNDFGKECYRLHFSQFYEEDDENVVAGFVQDETDENIFIYVSKELNVEYDTLFADSIEDAKHQIEDMLIDHLGIDSCVVNIGNTVRTLKHEIKPQLGDHWSKQTSTNLPARIRMTTLYAVSQTVNGRVANTCNLSETLLSWETRWGDAVGDFAPISDLTVKEVKAIGYELGLPNELIEKIPSDGLCGSTDEDALGFKYSVMDRYIRTGEIDDKDIKKKIDNRVEKYRFKRMPIPYYKTGMERYVD